jgi:hypothetical protein
MKIVDSLKSIVDSHKSIDIGGGITTVFVASPPINHVLQRPSEQPGLFYPLDFVLLFSVNYYRWWFLLLLWEKIFSGILQTEYRLDIVNVKVVG